MPPVRKNKGKGYDRIPLTERGPPSCKQPTAHTVNQKLEAQISKNYPGLRKDNKHGASCGPPGQWAALRVRAHEVCAANTTARVASLFYFVFSLK
jgi:hypothetical protein